MRKPLSVLLAASLALPFPRSAEACGGYFDPLVFTHDSGPDDLERYVAGDLGVLLPTYAPFYLTIAYRHLAGIGFDDDERSGFPEIVDESGNGVADWQSSLRVLGEPTSPIDVEAEVPGQPYVRYLNCPASAFRTAAGRLTEHVATYGRDSAELRSWVRAQETVFRNCSGRNMAFPEDLPPTSPPALRADRAYQIAAAHFYSRDWDGAASRFREIAADRSSPWRTLAPYLVARCLVRKGTLFDSATLPAALVEIDSVLSNPTLAPIHLDSLRLRRFVENRFEPGFWIRFARERALSRCAGSGLQQDVRHFSDLFERARAARVAPSSAEDSLTAWLILFHEGERRESEVFEKWRVEPASLPWIVAALSAARRGGAELLQLLDAAEKVPQASPAFPTVSYHRIRIALDSGDLAKASPALAAVLGLGADRLSRSSWNLLSSLRLRTAGTLEELLQDAFQQPPPPRHRRPTEPPVEPPAPARYLTDDAYHLLNALPIEKLVDASESPTVPTELTEAFRTALTTRAILLDDRAILKRYEPAIDDELGAVTWLLDHDGARPDVPGANEFSFGFYWWRFVPNEPTFLSFLTAAERSVAAGELARLRAAGFAASYLACRTLAAARKSPGDPRAPRALHRAVQATRYGIGDSETAGLSKEAFRLLHSRYPDSEWTAKTKYWYAGRR